LKTRITHIQLQQFTIVGGNNDNGFVLTFFQNDELIDVFLLASQQGSGKRHNTAKGSKK
jgi:hypothetical protein